MILGHDVDRQPGADRVEVAPEQVEHQLVEMAGDDVVALPAADGPVDRSVAIRVVEDDPHRPGRVGRRRVRVHRVELAAQSVPQVVEARHEQCVLVPEVGVERGSADVGAIEHVLHRDPFVAPIHDQLDQCLLQRAPGSAYPAVRLGHAHPFPDLISGQIPACVRYRTTGPDWSLTSTGTLTPYSNMVFSSEQIVWLPIPAVAS